MTTYDAIVAGAGPAGSTAARLLARQGAGVLLLDKARFPRDKVCAGWITPPVLRARGVDPQDYAKGGRVLQPIREIGRVCKERGVLLHTDATQAVGKVPVHVIQDNIDLMSMSAHKMYGPKGVGALYVRRKSPRVQVTSQMDGGGHERGMRSGTLNVPGIVGMGKACEIAKAEMAEEGKRLAFLRDNGYDAENRGEQTWCVAAKREALPVDRFPWFVYSE